MSLIARVLQPVDFQCIPVTCKPKTDVTHVTRMGKWHQWHQKNKHMSPGNTDIQTIMLPVQWVTWVCKPFFIFPLYPYPSVILSTAKNLLTSTNACQIREGELKKRLHVFPKRQQLFRILLQLFSILEEALCRETICCICYYQLITATNGYYLLVAVNCIKCTNCTLVLDVLIVYRIIQIDMCTYTYMVNSVTKYVCVQTHTYIWSRHGKNKKH